MEERYETPEVITFSDTEFEPAFAIDCPSLFSCNSIDFLDP